MKKNLLIWREKVISYYIKYVDEMDALSNGRKAAVVAALRELPLNGVLSTCFGHDQQPQCNTLVFLNINSSNSIILQNHMNC